MLRRALILAVAIAAIGSALALRPAAADPAGGAVRSAGRPVGGADERASLASAGRAARSDAASSASASSGAAGAAQPASPAAAAPASPSSPSATDPSRPAGAADDPVAALRQRMAAAVALAARAAAGDAAARAAAEAQADAEPDPRVRHALRTGEPVPLGEARPWRPRLPPAAGAAPPGQMEVPWQARGDSLTSMISIGADGRAVVETRSRTRDGDAWHVRYLAWAWRDAAGGLVLDARGAAVDILDGPPEGGWSPDSMVVGRDGQVRIIDDNRVEGDGAAAGTTRG